MSSKSKQKKFLQFTSRKRLRSEAKEGREEGAEKSLFVILLPFGAFIKAR
jgi:hypothetical protein